MKLRQLNIEVFTGTDPASLTNSDGDELQSWLKNRTEQEFIEPIEVLNVGGTVWVFIQYAEGG